jgi:hypothetical protein
VNSNYKNVIMMSNWLIIVIGLYLIVKGLRSKTLLNEADVPATDEERANARATPVGRIIITAAGIGACVIGLIRLFR